MTEPKTQELEVAIQPGARQTLKWEPDAIIQMSGLELDSLVRLSSFFDIPPSQLTPRDIQNAFSPALTNLQEIFGRMKKAGIAREVMMNPDGSIAELPLEPEETPKTKSSKMTNHTPAKARK